MSAGSRAPRPRGLFIAALLLLTLALAALSRAKAGVADTPLPAPGQLPAATDLHSADFHKLARYTFRYDLRTHRLETAGATPSLAVRTWLRDTLPVHSRTMYNPKY